MKKIISISVKNLVEYSLKKGDLRGGIFSSSSRAIIGTKIHQKIQKSRNGFYKPEVTVKHPFLFNNFQILVQGRIDGIFDDDESKPVIEEIKTTAKDLDILEESPDILHLSQLKCYAYIVAKERNLTEISTQLTYYQIDSQKILEIHNTFSLIELEGFINGLVKNYGVWAEKINNYLLVRDETIRNLKFPFGGFRKGQRDLSKYVFRAIREESDLFVQAPTGIGKTIGVLFPALKALEKDFGQRIFYLTAKTVGRLVADNTLEILRNNGLIFKSIMLTAKEKICFQDEVNCDPEECVYARKYYNKINTAIADIFHHQRFSRELIEEYAKKHQICPFEFSLDLALWSDCIICDYNYAFDPRVHLKRFFENTSENYIFLIDEAHNLPDRAREMFSASFEKQDILKLKKNLMKNLPKISSSLEKINKILIEKRKTAKTQDKFYTEDLPDEKLTSEIKNFLNKSEKWLSKNIQTNYRKELLDTYFLLKNYFKIALEYNSGYITYNELLPRNNLNTKLFCLDPSIMLATAFARAKSKIFFSATLLPMEYFQQILTGDFSTSALVLHSPFPRKNLEIHLNSKISTTYRQRDFFYDDIAKLIANFVSKNPGNFFVFFPSYKFMNEIYERIDAENLETEILIQSSGMAEKEKEDFLNQFEEKRNVAGFVVMGGIFGEGIDLIGEKLSGAIIVGVGLPQISKERNLIRNYYDEKNKRGFEYAYQIPGISRVFQAMGRVIRSETDKGKILLIDQRFSTYRYKKLFPDEWKY